MATNDSTTTDSDADADDVPADGIGPTTVHVRCTGHARMANGEHAFHYTFDDTTPRAFLPPFFAEYDIANLVPAETEAEATAHGLATTRRGPGPRIPRANRSVHPPGSPSTAGSTNGLDTSLADGDRGVVDVSLHRLFPKWSTVGNGE